MHLFVRLPTKIKKIHTFVLYSTLWKWLWKAIQKPKKMWIFTCVFTPCKTQKQEDEHAANMDPHLGLIFFLFLWTVSSWNASPWRVYSLYDKLNADPNNLRYQFFRGKQKAHPAYPPFSHKSLLPPPLPGLLSVCLSVDLSVSSPTLSLLQPIMHQTQSNDRACTFGFNWIDDCILEITSKSILFAKVWGLRVHIFLNVLSLSVCLWSSVSLSVFLCN